MRKNISRWHKCQCIAGFSLISVPVIIGMVNYLDDYEKRDVILPKYPIFTTSLKNNQ